MRTEEVSEPDEWDEEDTAQPMLPPNPPPDIPAEPRPPDFRPDFEERLLEAAASGAAPPAEACLAWGRMVPVVLPDEATVDERALAYFNIASACSVGEPHIENDRRLAAEALRRYRAQEGSSEAEADKLAASLVPDDGLRSFILFADAHSTGTRVFLDGELSCVEPCAVAIPVDGSAHLLEFVGEAGRAELSWAPEAAEGEAPALPGLK